MIYINIILVTNSSNYHIKLNIEYKDTSNMYLCIIKNEFYQTISGVLILHYLHLIIKLSHETIGDADNIKYVNTINIKCHQSHSTLTSSATSLHQKYR